jgi:hypothetical protein
MEGGWSGTDSKGIKCVDTEEEISMTEDFLNGAGMDLTGGSTVNTGTDNGGLVFNLNDVEEDKGFELLPKGTYAAVVDELEFGESSTGNPMFTVKYKIVEGEFEKRVLFDYWVLAGNGKDFGLGKLKKFLNRVVPEANMASFNPQAFADEGTAIGRELQVVVNITTQKKGDYKGEKRNQVKDILAATSGSFV